MLYTGRVGKNIVGKYLTYLARCNGLTSWADFRENNPRGTPPAA
jgi:hypothetical protein